MLENRENSAGSSDLSQVIEGGLCIGCGACLAADSSLELVLDEVKQSYRPSHPSGAAAASVCPAVSVDFDLLHEARFPGKQVGAHGVVDSVWLAQSTDEQRNLGASSGGLIKELLHALIRQDDVDGIISLVHEGGLNFGAALISNPEQIDELPGSIYHAIDFSNALKLLREHRGRFVLVAIPCQLEGIFSYIHTREPELARRIYGTIGLLCGWQYTHHSIRAICEYSGTNFDSLTNIAWRGNGPIGKLRLITRERETRISRRLNFSYQVAFDRSFNIPRCHMCINHSNFLADIVVGDAWLPSTVFTKTGISLIICRADWTRTLLESLSSKVRIKATRVTEEEITESQSRRVVFGDFAYAFQDYLRRRDLPHTKMTGPNRNQAVLATEQAVARFYAQIESKLAIQAKRSYRYLWWRKLAVELPALSQRYLNWFFNRLLRVRSLKGERQEVASEKIRMFR
jgi:coenzyme F420-reducing hydrogenase beta subunit